MSKRRAGSDRGPATGRPRLDNSPPQAYHIPWGGADYHELQHTATTLCDVVNALLAEYQRTEDVAGTLPFRQRVFNANRAAVHIRDTAALLRRKWKFDVYQSTGQVADQRPDIASTPTFEFLMHAGELVSSFRGIHRAMGGGLLLHHSLGEAARRAEQVRQDADNLCRVSNTDMAPLVRLPIPRDCTDALLADPDGVWALMSPDEMEDPLNAVAHLFGLRWQWIGRLLDMLELHFRGWLEEAYDSDRYLEDKRLHVNAKNAMNARFRTPPFRWDARALGAPEANQIDSVQASIVATYEAVDGFPGPGQEERGTSDGEAAARMRREVAERRPLVQEYWNLMNALRPRYERDPRYMPWFEAQWPRRR